jgi:predicted DNA-binding WGR domain protein
VAPEPSHKPELKPGGRVKVIGKAWSAIPGGGRFPDFEGVICRIVTHHHKLRIAQSTSPSARAIQITDGQSKWMVIESQRLVPIEEHIDVAMYECTHGGHNKFWEIWMTRSNPDGPVDTLHTRYGVIGTKGQQWSKYIGGPSLTKETHRKKCGEKEKKGYHLTQAVMTQWEELTDTFKGTPLPPEPQTDEPEDAPPLPKHLSRLDNIEDL